MGNRKRGQHSGHDIDAHMDFMLRRTAGPPVNLHNIFFHISYISPTTASAISSSELILMRLPCHAPKDLFGVGPPFSGLLSHCSLHLVGWAPPCTNPIDPNPKSPRRALPSLTLSPAPPCCLVLDVPMFTRLTTKCSGHNTRRLLMDGG